MLKRKYFALFGLLILMVSCTHDQAFVHKFDMKNHGWGKFSNLEFHQGSFVQNEAYSLQLDLVIDENYRESLFEFQLLIESEEGESWNKVFSIAIKDDDGNFLAENNNGTLIYHEVLLKTKYFNEKGNYSFEVVNLNSKIITKGIKSIAFIFEK